MHRTEDTTASGAVAMTTGYTEAVLSSNGKRLPEKYLIAELSEVEQSVRRVLND